MSESDDFYKKFDWKTPIAEGDYSTVYLATEKSTGTDCVIKQILMKGTTEGGEERALTLEELERRKYLFRREAEILEQVSHPGIVKYKASAEVDRRCFLITEYIQGNNLETLVRKYGPLNQEDAVKVGIQICETLEYLHQEGLVYGDLKPTHLILTPEGSVTFIDFRLSHPIDEEQTGQRFSHPFVAPEQYRGSAHPTSDLYSLGKLFIFLLTANQSMTLDTMLLHTGKNDVLLSLQRLINQLSSESVDDRIPSARHVRHSLYRIYKEIHPDFEVTDTRLPPTASPNSPDAYFVQLIGYLDSIRGVEPPVSSTIESQPDTAPNSKTTDQSTSEDSRNDEPPGEKKPWWRKFI